MYIAIWICGEQHGSGVFELRKRMWGAALCMWRMWEETSSPGCYHVPNRNCRSYIHLNTQEKNTGVSKTHNFGADSSVDAGPLSSIRVVHRRQLCIHKQTHCEKIAATLKMLERNSILRAALRTSLRGWATCFTMSNCLAFIFMLFL